MFPYNRHGGVLHLRAADDSTAGESAEERTRTWEAWVPRLGHREAARRALEDMKLTRPRSGWWGNRPQASQCCQ